MKKRVKAIIFDIGGVLAIDKKENRKQTKLGKVHIGVHESIAKSLKISIDQWFDSVESTFDLSVEGKIPRLKFTKLIAERVNSSPKKLQKIVIKSIRKHMKPNKELYKVAFKLKKQGYKIAILSDQFHLSKDALVLPKYMKKFDYVAISCDMGMRKPNPRIYKHVLKKLKVKPSEAVFIDNQTWNIKPAKKLGIKTILFKDNTRCLNELKKLINFK